MHARTHAHRHVLQNSLRYAACVQPITYCFILSMASASAKHCGCSCSKAAAVVTVRSAANPYQGPTTSC